MVTLNASVQKQQVTLTADRETLVAGSEGLYKLALTYDQEWEDITLRVVVFDGAVRRAVSETEGVVIIPPEPLSRPCRLGVGIIGYDSEGKVKIVTQSIPYGQRILVSYGGANDRDVAMENPDRDPTLWEKLAVSVGDLSLLETENKEDLVSAINEVLSKIGTGSSDADEILSRGVWYGSTSTAASTAEKVVTTESGDFNLFRGARLGVKFLTNTINCNSLIVDDCEQVYIKSSHNEDEDGTASSSMPCIWHNQGQVQWFTYDGTYFIIDDCIRATASNSLCGKVSVSDSVSSTGDTVASSTAVKTAYDKAVEALEAAESAAGADGSDYVLTDEDKTEIAEMAAALVDEALLTTIGTGEVTA